MYIKEILIRPWVKKKLGDDLEYYKNVLRAFKQDPERNGFHFEPLAGQSGKQELSSIRAGGAARIILSKIDNGVYVVTDVLVNHEYHHIQTLNPGEQEALAQGDEAGFILLEEPEMVETDELGVAVSDRIAFINNQFIVLDEEQHRAQLKGVSTLPLVISGAPGSGKTSVLLWVLRQNIESWSDSPRDAPLPKILVLAKSAHLIAKMQEEWEAIYNQEFQGDAQILPGDCVEFKTPEMIYKEAHPDAQFCGEQEFIAWYKDYAKPRNQLANQHKGKQNSRRKPTPKASVAPMVDIAQASLIYQEFYSMSGYASREAYEEGVSQQFSLFPDKAARTTLWDAFQAYKASLENNNRIDLAFVPIELGAAYRFIGVDETQDLSRLQIRSLVQNQPIEEGAVQQHNLLFNVGDHQRLFGSETTIPFIKTLFWERFKKEVEVAHETLQASYRCPKPIIALANAVLQLKYKAIGGSLVLDKNELPFVRARDAEAKGDIDWLENKAALDALIARQRDNAHFVVITSAAFLDEAIGLFGAERVFTAEQFKGLEARDVLLFHPLGQEGFAAANAVIGDHFVLSDPPEVTKDSGGKGSIRHSSLFNQLFVAVTRAQNNVTIYQPETQARFIRKALHRFCSEHKNPVTVTPVEPITSTREEWLEQAQKLHQQGLEEQAKLIEKKWAAKVADTPEQKRTSTAASSKNKIIKAAAKKSGKQPLKKKSQTKSAASVESQSQPVVSDSPITPQQPIDLESLLGRLVEDPGSVLEQIIQHEEGKKLIFDTPLKAINSALTFFQYLATNDELKKMFYPQLARLVAQYADPKTNPRHCDLLAGLLRYRPKDGQNIQPLAFGVLAQLPKDSIGRTFVRDYKANRARVLIEHVLQKNDLGSLRSLKHLDALDVSFDNQTLLFRLVSIKSVDIELVRDLIEAGADINITNEKGITPLYQALIKENIEAFKLLLNAKARVDILSVPEGCTVLHGAACSANPEWIKLVINACKDIIDRPTFIGKTALYCAVEYGRLESVQVLLDAGAYVDMDWSSEKITPLMYTSSHNDLIQLKILRLLLSVKPQVNLATGLSESTVLHIAASNNNIRAIRELLGACKDIIDKPNKGGETALFIAAANGYHECFEALLKAGADFDKPNKEGKTPLFIAISNSHIEIVRQLLKRKARVNQFPPDGLNVLHVASRCNDLNLLKLLIDTHKDLIAESTPSQVIPLHTAAVFQNIRYIKLLLKAGLEQFSDRSPRAGTGLTFKQYINYQDVEGSTALSFATKCNDFDIIELLVNAGADLNLGRKGITPIFVAVHNNNPKVVSYFLGKGADYRKLCRSSGKTLMAYAETKGLVVQGQVSQFIEQKGHSTDSQEELMISPLELAQILGHREIASCLEAKIKKTSHKSHVFFRSESNAPQATSTKSVNQPDLS